ISRSRPRKFCESSTNFITLRRILLFVLCSLCFVLCALCPVLRAWFPIPSPQTLWGVWLQVKAQRSKYQVHSSSPSAHRSRRSSRHAPANRKLSALTCLRAEVRIIHVKQNRSGHRCGNDFI